MTTLNGYNQSFMSDQPEEVAVNPEETSSGDPPEALPDASPSVPRIPVLFQVFDFDESNRVDCGPLRNYLRAFADEIERDAMNQPLGNPQTAKNLTTQDVEFEYEKSFPPVKERLKRRFPPIPPLEDEEIQDSEIFLDAGCSAPSKT